MTLMFLQMRSHYVVYLTLNTLVNLPAPAFLIVEPTGMLHTTRLFFFFFLGFLGARVGNQTRNKLGKYCATELHALPEDTMSRHGDEHSSTSELAMLKLEDTDFKKNKKEEKERTLQPCVAASVIPAP